MSSSKARGTDSSQKQLTSSWGHLVHASTPQVKVGTREKSNSTSHAGDKFPRVSVNYRLCEAKNRNSHSRHCLGRAADSASRGDSRSQEHVWLCFQLELCSASPRHAHLCPGCETEEQSERSKRSRRDSTQQGLPSLSSC